MVLCRALAPVVIFLVCLSQHEVESREPETRNVGTKDGSATPGETTLCQTVAAESHVWGPGVTLAASNTPVRYFFVHAVCQESGKNFSNSPGPDAFSIQFTDGDDANVRVHREVFDRQDGSFVVRYRPYRFHKKLTISVLTDSGVPLKGSPFTLHAVRQENCFCPQMLDAFKTSFRCPVDGYKQIDADLARFAPVNLTSSIPETIHRFSDKNGACFAHYSIINNKVYAKVHGPHTGFRMFSDAFLSSLVRKVQLPDVEFIINLGDYPQEKRLSDPDKLPVFSWCGSSGHADIVMPTYDVTQATVESMTRVHQDMFSSQERNAGHLWPEKLPVAFWRGRDSRQERLDLVRLSKRTPSLLNAGLTNYFFFTDQEEALGRTPYVPFKDFFKYKYQVNLDGTVAAYRFPWLLAGGSAVLKQDSPYYEHFYGQLEPWKHYVPVKRDLSDLLEQIKWLQNNDDKARQIAENGVEFARQHLKPESIYCYYALLFEKYADKLTTKPTVRDGMEELKQPDAQCDCSTDPAADHDEL